VKVSQPIGTRGSLQFMQQLVSRHPQRLTQLLREAGALRHERELVWRSPLPDDGWAEYRDAAFLEQVGLLHLAPQLAAFWPSRGPQWDALAVAGETVILVEAKAHVGELISHCAARDEGSRALIRQSLNATRRALGATGDRDWMHEYYQLANRLAHLWFLRSHGVDAQLVLLNFTGDTGMPSPSTPAAFADAYSAAHAQLGLASNVTVPGLTHLYLDVSELN
jgi:hypothetical protein